MRRSKQNAIRIARAGIVALTFILAFAIIIAAPIESSTDVALADVNKVYGGTATINGNNGELNADNTGFVGSSLVITESFSSVNFSSSNVSYAVVNTDKTGTFSGGTGTFSVGINQNVSWPNGYQVYAVLNYKISPWLLRYVSGSSHHTNAKLEIIDFRASYSKTQGNQAGLKLFTTSSPFVIKAKDDTTANQLGVADTPSTFAYVTTSGKASGTLSYSTKVSESNPLAEMLQATLPN